MIPSAARDAPPQAGGVMARLRARLLAQQRVKLHFLNAGHTKIGHRALIRKQVRIAYAFAVRRLPIGCLDVVVQVAPAMTLPEIGVGAYSPSAELVFVFIDPQHSQLASCLASELAPITVHEFMHAMRWRGPGYGTTLGEALVSEGLALHFEAMLRGAVPWYAAAPDEAVLERLESEARARWSDEAYERLVWFSPRVDTWGLAYRGYALGYRLVARRLAEWGLPLESVWDRPAALF